MDSGNKYLVVTANPEQFTLLIISIILKYNCYISSFSLTYIILI